MILKAIMNKKIQARYKKFLESSAGSGYLLQSWFGTGI